MTATRITLIDDHPAFLEVLDDLLTDDGYLVTALSGDGTTIEEIVATRPDLLILDLIFAGGAEQLTGWEYLRLIRSHGALHMVPVLVCSGDAISLRRRQKELRGDAQLSVLPKPFSVDQVELAITELLDAQRVPHWDDERELVLVADAHAHLVDGSSAVLRALGMSLEELRERTVADIIAQSPEWTGKEWHLYQKARRWEGPVRLRRMDGTEIGASASAEIVAIASHDWHVSRLQLVPTA